MLAEPDLSAFRIDGTRVVAGHVELAPAECQLFVRGVRTRRIRTRLEEVSPDWRYIHTHFGVGYRFEPEPVTA